MYMYTSISVVTTELALKAKKECQIYANFTFVLHVREIISYIYLARTL